MSKDRKMVSPKRKGIFLCSEIGLTRTSKRGSTSGKFRECLWNEGGREVEYEKNASKAHA